MDEPLSNLDAKLRVAMRGELTRLHDRLGVTTVYVTHDQVEAMTLGQRVAVLRDGILQQVDTPQALFREPANLFVAAFIGSPSMNLAEAAAGGGRVRFAGFDLPLPPGAKLDTERLVVGIRPTDFLDPDAAPADLPRITVTATVVEDLGAEAHVIFAVDAPRVSVDAVRAAADTSHEDDDALLVDDERALFTARVDAHHAVAPGQQLELAIDPRRLHFFDAASGSVLGRRPLGVVPAQP
jgi:multiple sugar transport system ATP-binding protein